MIYIYISIYTHTQTHTYQHTLQLPIDGLVIASHTLHSCQPKTRFLCHCLVSKTMSQFLFVSELMTCVCPYWYMWLQNVEFNVVFVRPGITLSLWRDSEIQEQSNWVFLCRFVSDSNYKRQRSLFYSLSTQTWLEATRPPCWPPCDTPSTCPTSAPFYTSGNSDNKGRISHEATSRKDISIRSSINKTKTVTALLTPANKPFTARWP